MFITGENARASKSVKKQYNERPKAVNAQQPENLDVKFRYIELMFVCQYILFIYCILYSAEEQKEEVKEEVIIEEKKGM